MPAGCPVGINYVLCDFRMNIRDYLTEHDVFSMINYVNFIRISIIKESFCIKEGNG